MKMSADEQIISLLEVITFIITKLSLEEANHVKTKIFSDYFRKHLNLLDEQKTKSKGEEKCNTKHQNTFVENQNIGKEFQNRDLRKSVKVISKKADENNPVKENIDNESNHKRLKLEQIQMPKQELFIKAQPLDSFDDKRKIKRTGALNEKIFDACQPAIRNQSTFHQEQDSSLNQSQRSIKMNKTFTTSSGLELQIDKVMEIKESSQVKNKTNQQFSCTICNLEMGGTISFESIERLSQHDLEEHKSEGYYICPVCYNRNESKTDLLKHYSLTHRTLQGGYNDKIHCPLCKKYYYLSKRHYPYLTGDCAKTQLRPSEPSN